MTDTWILSNMKINMDMFRYFMVVTYPFVEWMCDSYYDVDKLRRMFHEQMDSEEFLYANVFFYQKILRGAMELTEEHKSIVIEKLSEKMEMAGEVMKNGEYLSTCNYFKKAMDKISFLNYQFQGYNLYVYQVTPGEIILRKLRPKMFHVDNKENETFNLVKNIMRNDDDHVRDDDDSTITLLDEEEEATIAGEEEDVPEVLVVDDD